MEPTQDCSSSRTNSTTTISTHLHIDREIITLNTVLRNKEITIPSHVIKNTVLRSKEITIPSNVITDRVTMALNKDYKINSTRRQPSTGVPSLARKTIGSDSSGSTRRMTTRMKKSEHLHPLFPMNIIMLWFSTTE